MSADILPSPRSLSSLACLIVAWGILTLASCAPRSDGGGRPPPPAILIDRPLTAEEKAAWMKQLTAAEKTAEEQAAPAIELAGASITRDPAHPDRAVVNVSV